MDQSRSITPRRKAIERWPQISRTMVLGSTSALMAAVAIAGVQQGQLEALAGWPDKLGSATQQLLDGVKAAVDAKLTSARQESAKQLQPLPVTLDRIWSRLNELEGPSEKSGARPGVSRKEPV